MIIRGSSPAAPDHGVTAQPGCFEHMLMGI
jgi:hypothetical protein